jgi:hypothetical protein
MEPTVDPTKLGEEEAVALVEATEVEADEGSESKEDSGVQVGPGAEQTKEAEADANVGLELGDLIEIHSNLPDLETVRGRVYYIDETRMSILEEGKTRKLVVLDFEQDEDGDYVPKEEYQLTGIDIKEKRLLPSFVAQRGMAKGMLVETFTAEGDQLATYTIESVDEAHDSVLLKDDAGETLPLSFEFKGIPRDRSVAPFDVLRVVEAPKKEEAVPNEAAPGEVKEDVLDFEFLEELEAPDVEEIAGLFTATELPAWEMIYTDDEQVNDMLRERIRELDPAAQRSTKRIRVISRLVLTMLALRNDITRYSGGRPVGRKPAAFQTLVELLDKSQFPLAKLILNVSKSIYVDHGSQDLNAYEIGPVNDPIALSDPNITLHYLQDTVLKSIKYLETQLKDSAEGTETPGAGQAIPRWITIWQGFFNRFFQVLLPLRQDDSLKDIRFDQDFFRTELPKQEDETATLSGLPVLDSNRDELVSSASVGKVLFSLMRAIGPRFGRYGDGGLTHKVEDGDSAEIKGYLLFPLEYIRDLGYIRSGILAMDMAHALKTSMTMKRILQEAGGITDIPEPGKIISVSFDGSTLGNTEIADWLKGQALYGGGIGDLMPMLRSFGLLNAELSVQQKLVLDRKVSLYNGAVRKMIKEFREQIQKERTERKPPTVHSLLDQQRVYELFQLATSAQTGEEILRTLLADFKVRHPSYKSYDLAMFAYLYSYYPDLFLNALAQNPEVAKERLRAERDLYIRSVLDKLEGDKKLQDAGAPPQENPCQHVKDLVKIRKIPGNSDRMLTLHKFIQTYKLKKEDHWLWCNNGEPAHHLLCEHEYLLLQEFLRPKEKDVIHKEIILTFGGGKFNGQYICKQCGQPISDYEYETSLEYDDNGRPMSGRDVLVDEDAIAEENLQKALTAETEEDSKVPVQTEEDSKIYATLNELAGAVGIYPDRKSYLTMIQRVRNELALVPNRDRYALSQKAIKKAGRPTTDYEVFISRILVSLCAAALLIDVQTHIPEYVIRYTLAGCANPEFTGYPRDPDIRKPDTGMEYMACAISSISKRTAPWDTTGYQSISSSTTRQKEILFYLKTFTTKLAETPDIQQAIVEKKQYLLEIFGYESGFGRPKDVLPSGFLPVPYAPKKELGEEAESPVVAEAASMDEKVRAYIKQAHMYALQFGKYMPGSGITEASCCYNPLTNPGSFWKEKGALPALPQAEPPAGSKGSLLYIPMKTRPLERLFGSADVSIMYRLFLRVCFQGPRTGEQHEPGYDNICAWCGLHFPEDPRLPPPTRRYAKEGSKQKKFDSEYESALQDKQRKELDALREAGVAEINQENFEELLTEVERKTLIPPLEKPVLPNPIDNLRGMLSLLPPPYEDYEATLRQLLVQLDALPPDAPRRDVLNAFNELSTEAVEMEQEIRKRLGDANFTAYQEFVKQPPQDLGEALRTYFLIPFQRILNTKEDSPRQFKPIIKPSRTTEFGPEVMEDVLKAYTDHTAYLNAIAKDIPKSDKYIHAKIREAVSKLSVVIPLFIKILRPTAVKGGEVASEFLKRLIVGGIFSEFIMPNHVPPNEPGIVAPTSAITIPAKMPARILLACLLKYKNEGLKYSSEQIKELIQDRIEKEKMEVMRVKGDMTPEQRRLDNLLQKLGMGKWAVGGTKAIWRYDPDQYVSEKEAMAAAGITRFGPQVDVYEAEGGYDVVQTHEDDA